MRWRWVKNVRGRSSRPACTTSRKTPCFVNIEIHFAHRNPLVAALQQQTEQSLSDLAPYANLTLVRTSTRASSPPATHDRPALLIDGKVVPAETADTDTSTVPPIPSQRQITSYLAQALLAAGPSAIRLPLVHRRIVAIALLLLVTGALSSQFLAAGPVLTFAGLALLPVGLATNGTRSRRQPLMLGATIASFLSAAFLLWYFSPLLLTSDTADPPSSTVFYAALACLCLAYAAALVALFVRRRLRRDLKNRLLHTITDPA